MWPMSAAAAKEREGFEWMGAWMVMILFFILCCITFTFGTLLYWIFVKSPFGC